MRPPHDDRKQAVGLKSQDISELVELKRALEDNPFLDQCEPLFGRYWEKKMQFSLPKMRVKINITRLF